MKLFPSFMRLSVVLLLIATGVLFIGGKDPVGKKPEKGAPKDAWFDLDKQRKRIPYGPLKYYRISDTLKRTAKVDTNLFYDVFQYYTTPPKGPGECGCGRTYQLFPGEEYLLSWQGRFKNRYSLDSIDIVTVLSTYRDITRIYWLCYASRDFTDTTGLFPYKKGEITRPFLNPVLAEKWKNDTSYYESSSEFTNESTFRVTSVLKSNDGTCLDSTIQLFRIDYVDMCMLVNMARWKKGVQVVDYFEEEKER